MNLKQTLTSLACVSLTTGLSNAAIIIPTVDSVSSEVTFVDRFATNVVDGSGLSAGADTILGTADDLHGTGANDGWLTDPLGTNGTITFDLGGVFDVTDLLVWNYNEAGFPGHGMNAVTIRAAGADKVFDITQGGVTLTAGTGTGDIAAQVVNLSGFNGVQYIEISNTTNHGDTRSGLAEVRFDGVATVPEPSSFALLGLGSLAMLRRRRK